MADVKGDVDGSLILLLTTGRVDRAVREERTTDGLAAGATAGLAGGGSVGEGADVLLVEAVALVAVGCEVECEMFSLSSDGLEECCM